MKYLSALVFVCGCTAKASIPAKSTPAAIRAWNLRSEPEPLARVETTDIPGHADLCAAICDYQLEWWGTFGVYHLNDGVVDWQAHCEQEPFEQSIHRIRAFALAGFKGPIIEVLGRTHMGHGALYLYELQGRELTLLLCTEAVDFNADLIQYRNGVLDITYRQHTSTSPPDVILAGELEEHGEKEEMIFDASFCRRVFIWDSSQGKYSERLGDRVGF